MVDGLQNTAGIYAFVNTQNDARYIGASAFVWVRAKAHISHLNLHKHCNKAMQADWDTFGAGAFKVIVLEYVPDFTFLKEAETRHIAAARESGYRLYNVARAPMYNQVVWGVLPQK